MKGCMEIVTLRVFGAHVYIHWSAMVVMGALLASAIRTPLLAVITLGSYFGILFVHEAGHALFARRLGYQPFGIYLAFLHGRCLIEAPHNRKHESIIAWGGVVAQLVIAIPLIVLAQTTSISSMPGLGPVIAFLGYLSALVAVVNLAPSAALDGGKAWALVPILLAERRKPAKPSLPAEPRRYRREAGTKGTVTKGPWRPKDD